MSQNTSSAAGAILPEIGAREAYYTICPVFVASHVALEFGWIEEELARIGAKLSYLRALDPAIGWLPHFDNRLPHLFRDGGNIPSIWARADRSNTTLLGLTWNPQGGVIVTRVGSGIGRVGDLKGRRIGLYRSRVEAKVDWWRATGDRGIELALRLAGLTRADVEIVDVDATEQPIGSAARPSALWSEQRRRDIAFTPEIAALATGRVDAVYASHGRALRLVATGEYTVIEDLARHPDWTLQIANSPYALTVDADFAREQRDVVVAFLRAVVKAGHWINQNRAAAASIFTRVTYYPSAHAILETIAEVDFVPNLSAKNLAAIDIQKQFLRERGYVRNDFETQDWADPTLLAEASVGL